MAMTPNGMASAIISRISGSTDAVDANNKFYSALCEYVEGNAEAYYSWSAALTSTPYTPDPQVIIKATIKTTGSLSPSGATTCETALSIFSADLNRNAALWQVVWPAGFSLSPAFVIPTINITPSLATEQQSAMISVCSQIIDGIKQATQSATGSHVSFVGLASFSRII